jgi:phosphatidylglycerophosphate synthase
MPTETLTADCYSARERRAMEQGQRLRETILRPLLTGLSRVHVRPGAVTFASLASGLAFIPAWPASRPAALALLALHVILDGLDGPLARWQHRASARGSFTDTVCDQLVLAGVVVTLMADSLLSTWSGGAFLFLYTLVVAFAMVRNAIGIPYSWLVRPRFFLYAAILIELWLQNGMLNALTWCLTALLALKAASGFLAIRRALP